MQKRGKGEGSIRKRKDGRFEVRITGTSNGKTFRISRYAHTQEEATQLLHTLSVTMMQTPQYFLNLRHQGYELKGDKSCKNTCNF